MRDTRKADKNLKIRTSNLKIKTEKKDYTMADAKNVILFFQVFYIYIQIFIFLTPPGIKLSLQLAFEKYAKYIMIL